MINTTEDQTSAHERTSAYGETSEILIKVAIPAFCVLGIFTNFLCALVLFRQQQSSYLGRLERSANRYLIAQALCDLFFCLTAIPTIFISPNRTYMINDLRIYYDAYCAALINVFILSSTWLMVVVSAERMYGVLKPLQIRKVISKRRNIYTIVIVISSSIIFNVPILWRYKIVEMTHTNRTRAVIIETVLIDQRIDNAYRTLWSIMGNYLPLVLMSVATFSLLKKLTSSKKHPNVRKHFSAHPSSGYESETALFGAHLMRQSMIDNQSLRAPNKSICSSDQSIHQMVTQPRTPTQLNSPSMRHHWKSNWKNKSINHSINQSIDQYSCQFVGAKSPRRDQRYRNRTGSSPRMNTLLINSGQINSNKYTNINVKASKKWDEDKRIGSRLTSFTLVSAVLMFLVLVAPSETGRQLILATKGQSARNSDMYQLIEHIFNLTQTINFSTHFFLFSAISRLFRKTLKGMCLKAICLEPPLSPQPTRSMICHRLSISPTFTPNVNRIQTQRRSGRYLSVDTCTNGIDNFVDEGDSK